MGELGELRNRVDRAVERLSTTNETRRHQSRGLMTLLTDLEGKYEARADELEHCKQRIDALTRDNADLSALVDKLVRIVDTTVTGEDEDPLSRASTMAAGLAADWSGAEVGDAPETGATTGTEVIDVAHDPVAASDPVAAPADDEPTNDDVTGEIGLDAADDAVAGLGPDLRFEDVSEDELAGERLDGDAEELAALLDTPLTPNPVDREIVTMAAVSEDSFEVISDAADDAATPLDVAAFGAVETDPTEIDATAFDGAGDFDPIQEMLAADLDIPEIVLDDDEAISRIDPDEDTESSIRAMMARLEIAATRAKARADEAAETEAETDEAPAVAAGGMS